MDIIIYHKPYEQITQDVLSKKYELNNINNNKYIIHPCQNLENCLELQKKM